MPILIPILIFSIPIVAILSNAYLKAKKLELSKGISGLSLSEIEEFITLKDDVEILRNHNLLLEEQNKQLASRLENIEVIVANPEYEQKELPPISDEMKIKAKIEEKIKLKKNEES